jgi:hypothetical protein
MKLELIINANKFKQIVEYYQKGFEKDLWDFNLRKVLPSLIEEYFETIGEFKVNNSQEFIKELLTNK